MKIIMTSMIHSSSLEITIEHLELPFIVILLVGKENEEGEVVHMRRN
jgi:hypothetical protein